jgi:hypothetical protein
MMSSIMGGGGDHGVRQEQCKLENQLGAEQAKMQQV